MPFIDQKINNLGQDYFKQGALLVGDVSFANYRTDGTDDQIQLQSAIDDAFGDDEIKEIYIISNISVNANTDYNEVLGGSTRRIACRLRDNVKITIAAGSTISFNSGGNSGGTFTAVFGNYGNLSNAVVVCEGNNAFDGLSSTAGTEGSRFGAIDLDARSNSCTTLEGNTFVISGKRTAGNLVKAYNSNSSDASVAQNNVINVINANMCLSSALIERKGAGIEIYVDNVIDSLGDGLEIKNELTQSRVVIGTISGSTGQGLKVWTDTAITTAFNELDVTVHNIDTSTEHNIYIQGMDGTLSAQVFTAQKSGVHFENVELSGTSYYNNKLIITDLISKNNNQAGSTFSGIGGVAQYVQINGFDVSDDQTTATQYRGVDFSNSACDYISLLGGQADGNTNTEISITGFNSVVHKDVLSWSNQVEVSGVQTISSSKDIYLLTNGDEIKTPKFSDLDSNLPRKYIIACTSGTASLSASQEDDSSYKQIGNYTAGDTITLNSGQSVTLIKTATKWEILGDSSVSVLSVGNLTSSASDEIVNTTTFYTINTTTEWSKDIPLASENIGKTFEFHKTSSDFNLATFNRSGSDVVQGYDDPASAPVDTAVKMGLPNERMRLTATASGIWRVEYVRDLSFMELCVYRGTSDVTNIGNGTTDADFNATLRDGLNDVDSTYGFDLVNNWFEAPFKGIYQFDTSVFLDPSAALSCDALLQKAQASANTTFEIAEYSAGHYLASASIGGFPKINRNIILEKGDRIKLSIRNLTAATTVTFKYESTLNSNIIEPIGSYFKVRLIKPLY